MMAKEFILIFIAIVIVILSQVYGSQNIVNGENSGKNMISGGSEDSGNNINSIEINSIEKNISGNNTPFNATNTIMYDNINNKYKSIIMKDNDISNAILNGAKIIDAPKAVSQYDRDKFPAIYKYVPKESYKVIIEGKKLKLLIIFNNKKVLKKVNLMSLSLG